MMHRMKEVYQSATLGLPVWLVVAFSVLYNEICILQLLCLVYSYYHIQVENTTEGLIHLQREVRHM